MIFKLIGALGLVWISIGVLLKSRKIRNLLFILGGMFLIVYSTYIKDAIFITLQVVFILAAVYDLFKMR